ncbi:hypothetical protein [Micromonospora saelicesensis]|uniref:hypothetical protein n=1 Tax=Micromonospora saelicesensis TaxID=285676 RepID=UPI0011BE5BB7|nr:hypothetical protein [Micromonospora saelicesensis]
MSSGHEDALSERWQPGRGHWLLARRSTTTGEIAYHVCYGPRREPEGLRAMRTPPHHHRTYRRRRPLVRDLLHPRPAGTRLQDLR